MTLKRQILDRIRQTGPIPVADYMAECLLHPTLGYYTTRDPLGAGGDFITAPEISQMFGELIGLALAQCWLDQNSPTPFTLAELGPGRGTLMADLLRATRHVPGFHAAAQITLVEASPALRKRQQETLREYAPTWFDRVEDLPDQPLLLIANEFYDALPIRQFLRSGSVWRERQVGADGESLIFGLSAPLAVPALNHRLPDTAEGDLVETCPMATRMTSEIAARIATHGGAALIVDYGDWRALGDTLQAVRGHESTDPLAEPGAADLTAHVDFEPVAAAATAAGCAHTRLTAQGVFLERLGITARARSLAQGRDSAAQDHVAQAHRRLTHPAEMGNLFKVLGLYPTRGAPPPGLEP